MKILELDDARKVFEELGFTHQDLTCFNDGLYDVELLCSYSSKGAIVREMVIRCGDTRVNVNFEGHDLDADSFKHSFLSCKDFFESVYK